MEANQGEFTQSSVSNIGQKLRALAAGKIDEVGNFFVRNDPDGSGTVPYEQFKALVIKLTNVSEEGRGRGVLYVDPHSGSGHHENSAVT